MKCQNNNNKRFCKISTYPSSPQSPTKILYTNIRIIYYSYNQKAKEL